MGEYVICLGIILDRIISLYSPALIKRVRDGTECAIGEEHVGLGRVEDAWTKCLL